MADLNKRFCGYFEKYKYDKLDGLLDEIILYMLNLREILMIITFCGWSDNGIILMDIKMVNTKYQ